MRSVALVSLAALGIEIPRVPRTRSKGGGPGVTPLDSSAIDELKSPEGLLLQCANSLNLEPRLPPRGSLGLDFDGGFSYPVPKYGSGPVSHWLRSQRSGCLPVRAPPPPRSSPIRVSAKAWHVSLPQVPTKVWQPGLQRREHERVPDHQWVRVAASLLGVYTILDVEDYLTGPDTSTVLWESEELNLVLLPSSEPVS